MVAPAAIIASPWQVALSWALLSLPVDNPYHTGTKNQAIQRSGAPSHGLGFERGVGFKRVLSGYFLASSPFDSRGIQIQSFKI